jgi:hypothetical protein
MATSEIPSFINIGNILQKIAKKTSPPKAGFSLAVSINLRMSRFSRA